ncbi:hypothetical protein LCGC14_0768700, partial [marine sediment metagenome]
MVRKLQIAVQAREALLDDSKNVSPADPNAKFRCTLEDGGGAAQVTPCEDGLRDIRKVLEFVSLGR